MTPAPTPRTDAESFRSCIGDWGYGEFVPASFARDLERQLAAERALADRLAHWLMAIEIDEIVPDAWLPPVTKAIAAWKEARGA